MRRETIIAGGGTGLLFVIGLLFLVITILWKPKLVDSTLERFTLANEKVSLSVEYQALYRKAKDLQKDLVETKADHWQLSAGVLMFLSLILFAWHFDRTRLKRKLSEKSEGNMTKTE